MISQSTTGEDPQLATTEKSPCSNKDPAQTKVLKKKKKKTKAFKAV